MAKCLVGAAGGLTASDKAKLVPENIREGVTLFEGTPREVVGTLIDTAGLEPLAGTRFMYEQGRYGTAFLYWDGSKYSRVYGKISGSLTFVGKPKAVVVLDNTRYVTNACGIATPAVGVYTEGLTSNVLSWGNFYDWTYGSVIILGTKQ